MYKCLNCGHVFEDGEQKVVKENHGLPGGFYETSEYCPICGGDFEETKPCKVCGSEQLDDDLYDGFCLDCLRESITYNRLLEYLIDRDLLPHFMFEFYFDSSIPERVSDKLKETLREWYLRMRANDILTFKTDFLQLCKKYILEGDGECGRYDYAEWLSEKREKEVRK